MTVDETLPVSWVSDFAERYAEAWRSHDAERVLSFLTEDVVWDDPAMLAKRPLTERGEIKAFIESFWRAFPDAEFGRIQAGDEIYAAGDNRFAVPWRATGTMAGRLDPPGFVATGRRFQVEGIDLWEFRDGRLCRIRTVYDLLDWSRQIGVVPDPAGFGGRLMIPVQRLRAFLSRQTPRRNLGVGVPPTRRVRAGDALMLPWFSVLPPTGFGVLTTVGRKTGRARRHCVRAIRREDKAYLVAIPGAQAAWLKNIRANPQVHLRIRSGRFEGSAREFGDADERDEAMALFCGTLNRGDYAMCLIHRRGFPTRAKIERLVELWFKGGVPLVIDLRDA